VPAASEVMVEQHSRLDARAEDVWRRAVTPEGINHELAPWLQMTMPAALRGRTIDDLPLGRRLGRSWLLLFGLIPVDYDDLALAERGPGMRFLERSKMLSMSAWQHEREVVPDGSGCMVVDRLTFELRRPLSRVPGSSRLARATVAWLFRHRHRRLRTWFGGRQEGGELSAPRRPRAPAGATPPRGR
jgi:ligand-binding SRPBCC domain-containing protein